MAQPQYVADNFQMMANFYKTFATAVTLWMSCALCACGGGSGSPPPAPPAPTPVAFQHAITTLASPFLRKFPSGTYVIRNQAEFDTAWQSAPFEYFPFITEATVDQPMPSIVFTKTALLGVSQGVGSWCEAPRITDVIQSGQQLLVRYWVPVIGTQACRHTAPVVDFVLVPSFSGQVTFQQYVP